MQACPKPERTTQQQRKAGRTLNLLKPPPKERKPKVGLRRKTRLKRQTQAGVVKGLRQRTGFTLKRGQPLRYRSRSESAKRRVRMDANLREQVIAIWGECCIGSFLGPCRGRIEDMHIRTKGAHPELRHELANHLPGCTWHHREAPKNFQFYAPYTKGLWAAGDLLKAAANGKRPDPNIAELQGEIWRVIQAEERVSKRREG